MPTTTVLLDLDDTLLSNDINRFIPAYLEALGRRLGRFAHDKDLLQITYQAVQALNHKAPALTNLEVFTGHFCRSLGHPAETLQPILDTFYRQDYPQLQPYTRSLPEARQVVDRLQADGYKVVIATNPLFPAAVIDQRVQWAGLGDLSFDLVTSMDNSYFCKPDPRYYRDILERVNSRPAESWMVGDNPVNDIVPARSLGMKTWWITPSPSGAVPEAPAPETDRQGSLREFWAWLEAGGLANEQS